MTPPPDSTSRLADLQAAFARALQAAEPEPSQLQFVTPAPPATACERIDVYRNNTRQFFRAALGNIYPVVRRRVGEDYFRQLAQEFGVAHPSQSGDIGRIGAPFSGWLRARLAGSADYAWLADLAELEWACEEAAMSAARDAATLASLGAVPEDAWADVQLELQPSVRFVASRWPIWSVWQANQSDGPAAPVDLGLGAEHCVVACTGESVAVYRLVAADHALLQQLAAGATLGAALEATAADDTAFQRVLGFAYAEGLVTAVVSPCARA